MPKIAKTISAGDAAIALARAGTASNKATVKALWSIRGRLLITVPGFPFPLEVSRAALVSTLQALPDDDASGLSISGSGLEWILTVGAPAPAAPKRSKRAPKAAPPVELEPAGSEGGGAPSEE